MDKCTCTPGTLEGGWHEQRCARCLALERATWDLIPAVMAEIRAVGLDTWTAQQEAVHQQALYDYLGMERAR